MMMYYDVISLLYIPYALHLAVSLKKSVISLSHTVVVAIALAAAVRRDVTYVLWQTSYYCASGYTA